MNHVCKCRGCHLELFPGGPKKPDQQHIAVRFGDRYWTVTVDGTPVEYPNEALAGQHGYVVFFPVAGIAKNASGEPMVGRHICATCVPGKYGRDGENKPNAGVCEDVAFGRVEIAPMERPAKVTA